MNVKPVASPHQVAPTTPDRAAQQDARQRAIAKLTSAPTPQPEQPVVQNQTQVSAEEMGAIRAPQGQLDTSVPPESQVDTKNSVSSELQTQETKPQEDPALSRQFAQLARQEKALRARVQQQEQAIKAREAALAAKEAAISSELESKYKTGYVSKDMFKQDALTALAEAGVSYEELTQQLLNQTPVDPRINSTISKLEAKIQELEKRNDESRKAAEDQQTQAYQAALRQIKNDVTSLVDQDPAYETIKATRSIDDVVELIEKTYKEDNILLSVDEAAQQVEDYLVEEALKITRINKIKQKLGQATSFSQQQTQKPSQSEQTQPTMKTLTNSTASTRKPSGKERAILAFKGELKS